MIRLPAKFSFSIYFVYKSKGKFDFGMLKTDLLYHYGKAGLFFSVAGCNKFEPSIIKSQILK